MSLQTKQILFLTFPVICSSKSADSHPRRIYGFELHIESFVNALINIESAYVGGILGQIHGYGSIKLRHVSG